MRFGQVGGEERKTAGCETGYTALVVRERRLSEAPANAPGALLWSGVFTWALGVELRLQPAPVWNIDWRHVGVSPCSAQAALAPVSAAKAGHVVVTALSCVLRCISAAVVDLEYAKLICPGTMAGMEKKSQTVKLAALAALAAAVMAVALSAGVFKVTYTYENGVVKMVDPQGGVHTVALNLKEGVKKVEVRLLPNGSAVLLEGGRPIAVVKIVMRGGEARRVEFKLLPNGTLLVIDGGRIWSRGIIEWKGGAEGAGQAGDIRAR
ncbi:hypothetical protein Pisl_0421 [Pyrobaculum islandicum DSM 4184]|uniref:Uncharacterized protein n=1 Tax=Pyrobaculum islandicum (strain DSM 4184 / JCM 9189 / GEO3) TaxID=384616 RepID=A1RRL7_PYRIL|nr:hypothetical protein [Pyrobaculum islandicum]ABL87599.1 hypothetical protein Pisl_0421 [Pyrobaculum islandicum DSM 4184]